MIEKIVLDYLSTALSPVACVMETPEQPTPARYVVIEKTGGSVTNHIPSANIAVKSCAETLYDAALLNEAVKEAMDDIITLASVSSCKLDNDYNFTDAKTKTYRYQAIFRITFMEV